MITIFKVNIVLFLTLIWSDAWYICIYTYTYVHADIRHLKPGTNEPKKALKIPEDPRTPEAEARGQKG